VRWVSDGTGEFEVSEIERAERGTSITLHLKEDALDYLNAWKLKGIINKYSDHISLPILMQKEEWKEGENDQPGEMVFTGEWETVNQAAALWTRAKKDITQDQYDEFYKQISYDSEAPLATTHNRVEGSTEYTQLLFIPAKAPMDMFNRDKAAGVKLYVKRVFIMDDAQALMPTYLRFVKGVVDSSDLPLNVSRELLQESRAVKAIREGCTKRVLSMIEDMAANDAEKFAAFYAEFGAVLKEGLGEDFANRERLCQAAALCVIDDRHGECGLCRLQGPHERRPGRDLLHHRRHAGRREKQPAAGDLPQEGHRSAADGRSRGRMGAQLPARL
jgi:molecular chaperone HtpG